MGIISHIILKFYNILRTNSSYNRKLYIIKVLKVSHKLNWL